MGLDPVRVAIYNREQQSRVEVGPARVSRTGPEEFRPDAYGKGWAERRVRTMEDGCRGGLVFLSPVAPTLVRFASVCMDTLPRKQFHPPFG